MILTYSHHATPHDNEYDRKHEDIHSLMVPKDGQMIHIRKQDEDWNSDETMKLKLGYVICGK
jgi:hypothetical protein